MSPASPGAVSPRLQPSQRDIPATAQCPVYNMCQTWYASDARAKRLKYVGETGMYH